MHIEYGDTGIYTGYFFLSKIQIIIFHFWTAMQKLQWKAEYIFPCQYIHEYARTLLQTLVSSKCGSKLSIL